MDLALRTPLLDLFRRGEAPLEVRLLAARGALAPRAHEQLSLLILLVADEDADVAAEAARTLQRIPASALSAFLARKDVSEEMRGFFASRGVQVSDVQTTEPADELLQPLVAEGEQPPGENQEEDDRELTDEERLSVAEQLSRLPVAEKMKRAMLGSREERFILIRDKNRLIASAVLSSPKVSPADVESFAKMSNVSEEVLRIIGNSRQWVKRYTVTAALALNPKTPVAVSLALVPRLVERDVKTLMRDRNIPEPVRAAARRIIANTESRRG